MHEFTGFASVYSFSALASLSKVNKVPLMSAFSRAGLDPILEIGAILGHENLLCRAVQGGNLSILVCLLQIHKYKYVSVGVYL
jgi:hypothetical protein